MMSTITTNLPQHNLDLFEVHSSTPVGNTCTSRSFVAQAGSSGSPQRHPGAPRTPGAGGRKGGAACNVGGIISDVGSLRPREVKKDRQDKAEGGG